MRSLITKDIPGASTSSPTIGKRQFFQDRNNQNRNSYNPKYLYNYDPKAKNVRNPLQYEYIAQTSSPLQPKEPVNIFTNQKLSKPNGQDYTLQRDILDQQVAQQKIEKLQTTNSYTNEQQQQLPGYRQLAQQEPFNQDQQAEKQIKLLQPNPITQQIIPRIVQRQPPPSLNIQKPYHSISLYQQPSQTFQQQPNGQYQESSNKPMPQQIPANQNDYNKNIHINLQPAASTTSQSLIQLQKTKDVPTRYGLTYQAFKEEDRAGSPTARKFGQMKKLIQQDDLKSQQIDLLGGKHNSKLQKNNEDDYQRRHQSLHQGQFDEQSNMDRQALSNNSEMISQQTQTIENKNPVLEASPFYVAPKLEKILVIQDSNSQIRDQVFKFLTTRGVWDYEIFSLPGSCAGLIEKEEWGKHFIQFTNFLLNEYVITDIYVFSSMISPMIKHYKDLDSLSVNPNMIRELHHKYLVLTKQWLEKKLGINGVMVRCFLFDHKEHVEKVL